MMRFKKVKQEKIDKFIHELNSGTYKGMKVTAIHDLDYVKIYKIEEKWIVLYYKPLSYVFEYKLYKAFKPK